MFIIPLMAAVSEASTLFVREVVSVEARESSLAKERLERQSLCRMLTSRAKVASCETSLLSRPVAHASSNTLHLVLAIGPMLGASQMPCA